MPKAHEEIAALNEKLQIEEDKFLSGNQSAGTRARKILQQIKKVCQTGRKAIQDAKGSDDDAEAA